MNLRGCVYSHFAFNFFDLFYLVCTFNSLHVLAHSWSWPHIYRVHVYVYVRIFVCSALALSIWTTETEEGLLHAFELRLFHGASFLHRQEKS